MNHPGTTKPQWRELTWVYAVTLVVTGLASAVQGWVAWLDGYLLVIAAATFLYLPLEVIARRGGDPADYGIHRRNLLRATLMALLLCAVIFPPYSLGFHLWQTEVVGQRFEPEKARFDRWPLTVRGIPARPVPAEGQVHLFHQNERFWLSWNLAPDEPLEVLAKSDGPFEAVEGNWGTHPLGLRLSGGSEGRATIESRAESLTFELKGGDTPLGADNIRIGAAFSAADANPVPFERGYFWLLELILVQLLLVALPEEVFFRGYLQTMVDRLWGKDRKVLGVQFNVESAILVSVLFAIGHFLTVPSAARLAVFFPSMVFCWLRRASGGVATPILFHAACNLYVEMALVYYQPS